MQLASPSSPHTCVPFVIRDGPVTAGCWLGGRPPEGIAPARSDGSKRYFATLPLAAQTAIFVSIFVSELEELMPARGRLSAVGLIQAVIHPLRPRSRVDSPLDGALSEHSLQFLSPADDWVVGEDGERVVRPNHKIGGRPHLVRPAPQLLADLGQLALEGYSTVVQFDFPSGEDAMVSGDWPFADGMFALLGREPFGPDEWRWYWDF
jgi:hypothetical protein